MPISVPGTSSRRKNRGFTLIELLVVLLIMGLAAGLIGTLARPGERAQLRVEAERLAQLLDLAAVESRLTGKPIAFTAEISKYSFWRWREDAGWSEAREDFRGGSLRSRSLPPGMAISGLRIEFDPYVPVVYEVQMSLGQARYSIDASPIGEVRIHEPQ
jgi:general secretion pathway protein H